MNEKHLALFTRVEDGLPEKSGYYLCICNNGIEEWSSIQLWIVKDGKSYWFDSIHIKYWLNLGTLTTKQKAIKLAEDAYYEGRYFNDKKARGENLSIETFINQGKERL